MERPSFRQQALRFFLRAVNELDGRGWPMAYSVFPGARAYKDFLQDRATVTKAVAAFVSDHRPIGGRDGTTNF